MFYHDLNLVLISFYTLARKECYRVIRIWPQTILPTITISFLYFFIFGHIMSKKIGTIFGYNYIQYITPGLIMMLVITNSYSNIVSSFFSYKFQKNIEEILISPISNNTIILGFVFGSFFRSVIVFFIVFFISNFFCDIYIYNFIIIFLILILIIFLFSLLGMINGIFAKKFDDVSIFSTFILSPLIYLGGLFYSLDFLPYNLKFLLYINPIFYIVNIFRYGFLGISEVNINLSIIFVCLFIFLLYFYLLFLLKFGYELKK